MPERWLPLEAKAQAKALVARFKDLWRDEIGHSDSYGVTVKYEHDGKTQQLTRLLSAALEDGSAGATHQAVAAAISKIRSL